MVITKQSLKEFRTEFNNTVKELEKKHNISISLGNIRFSEDEFNVKMQVVNKNTKPKLTKNDFRIGEIVSIDHKTINSKDRFRVKKINSKNIIVEKIVEEGLVGGLLNVHPSILKKV